MPQSLGGLNFGRGTVAIALSLVIIAWVGYLSVSKVDVERGVTFLGRSALREQVSETPM